jgi:TP901 family phage tail tape measure protein
MASSSSLRAGRAHVEFWLQDSPLRRGLVMAERRMQQFAASIQNIGRKAFTAGLAGLASFALPIKQMMAFDDAIKMTGAVSQATGAEIEILKNHALELGRTTSFTAVEVANLMGELGKAGFKTDEIKAMTGAVLDLSRASGTDAVMASGIMAATLKQFALGAGDATRVADVLTHAANATFNSVEGLGEALSYAGVNAAQAGMSLEETVALLGTLGDIGIQGSNAGTAVRRLTTITAAEATKMREIFGVEFLDAAGNIRPMIDVMGELAQATNGLPSGERMAKFNEAFGLLGITSASAISDSAANTKDLTTALMNAQGVAGKTSIAMDSGPGGAWRRLTSAAEGASIQIGYALAPTFEKLAAWISDATTKITDWVKENNGLIVSAAKASGYLFLGGIALVGISKALTVAAFGAGVLNLALGAVSIGVSAFTGVIGIASTIMGIAGTAWAVLSGLTASGTIAYSVATGAVALFQIAVLSLTSIETLAAIATTAMEIATIAGSVAYSIATLAVTSFEIAIIALKSGQVLAAIATYGLAAAQAIATGVMTAGTIAYSLITWAVSMFQIALISLSTVQGITALATTVLSGALSALGTVIVFMTSPLGLIVAGIAAIGFIAGSIGNPITALTGMLGGAASAFSGMAGKIMETASMLMNVYKPAWDLIVGMIKSGDISGAMTFAWELAKASFSLGIEYIKQAWGGFSDWLSNSVSSIGLTIGEIWGAMWDNFIGVAQYAWAAIKDTLNAVVDFGRSLVGATKIDRKSNVDQVTKDRNARQDARAQESFDAQAKLAAQQKTGEDARQAAVDAQLAKINELISTEKARSEAQRTTLTTPPPPPLPPAQQALANTLMAGTSAAMTARASAITAVDKNSAEGQKLIYESLDQSGKQEDTTAAVVDMKETLVDEFERSRREDAQAPRLAGSRKS